jgi:hypothetical protein
MNSEERITAAAQEICSRAYEHGARSMLASEAREIAKAALEAAGLNELVEALEPFSAEVAHWKRWGEDDEVVEPFDGYEGRLTVGDLRKARAALTGDKSNG